MDFQENFIINFQGIKKDVSNALIFQCITDIPHFFLSNLLLKFIENLCVALITKA